MQGTNPYEAPNAYSKYQEMRVKYLFMDLTYANYIKLQVVCVALWTIAAVVLFIYAQDSATWLIRNGWWLCLLAGIGEVFEAFIAISRAKRSFDAEKPTGP